MLDTIGGVRAMRPLLSPEGLGEKEGKEKGRPYRKVQEVYGGAPSS